MKGLPEAEQRTVFEHFLERGIGVAHPQLRGPAAPGLRLDPGASSTLFIPQSPAQKPMGPQQITIPVRLSEEQHQRLKHWSATHSFPMAVIVRGLIERFLDGWEEREP